MIHTYSLIHDDLPAMDDDELRRGRPTSHVVNGEGMAILAGDGLQAEAFALLAREPQGTPSHVDHAQAARDRDRSPTRQERRAWLAARRSISPPSKPGPASPGHAASTPTACKAMHLRKTGALIRASVAAGAIMGGADDRLLATLDTYATEIGLAFQIVDDILDEEGSAGSLGKTAGKDRAAGKPTYPAFYGLDRSRELAGGLP